MAGRRYTRELLEEAARRATSWDEAVRFCGGEPDRYNKRYLHQKMSEAGIDVAHFQHGAVRHTDEALRSAVAASHSVSDVVRYLGINNVGGNQAHIGRRIAALGIDTSHFAPTKQKPGGSAASPLSLRSPEDGRVHGVRLRRELLRLGVPEQCAACGRPEWRGRPISLEVDHVSGEWWDNRPDNLRLLCPNCHAVTDTYRGRKRRSA
ncbi:HNH endonuclease [Streptomyces sp. NPDC050264]|uniref:HNH endonuclease n=1 Tax=Streptomyces sp. NPDC050264 TaxID=3155038 RepID=UPI003439C2DD